VFVTFFLFCIFQPVVARAAGEHAGAAEGRGWAAVEEGGRDDGEPEQRGDDGGDEEVLGCAGEELAEWAGRGE